MSITMGKLAVAGVTLATIALSNSCASKAAKTPESTQSPGVSSDGTSNSTKDFRTLPATSITLKESDGATTTTPYAKAKASGKAYTVFQFSGVTCESCQADSPKVQRDLSTLKNVNRVVVFPNQFSGYSQAEYQGFINSYAPGAQRLVDSDLNVLKSIRRDSAQFFGLYLVVRASDGKGFILNDTDAHLKIFNAVRNLP